MKRKFYKMILCAVAIFAMQGCANLDEVKPSAGPKDEVQAEVSEADCDKIFEEKKNYYWDDKIGETEVIYNKSISSCIALNSYYQPESETHFVTVVNLAGGDKDILLTYALRPKNKDCAFSYTLNSHWPGQNFDQEGCDIENGQSKLNEILTSTGFKYQYIADIPEKQLPSNTKEYLSQVGAFSLNYPDSWTFMEQGSPDPSLVQWVYFMPSADKAGKGFDSVDIKVYSDKGPGYLEEVGSQNAITKESGGKYFIFNYRSNNSPEDTKKVFEEIIESFKFL